jgi:zinc protease
MNHPSLKAFGLLTAMILATPGAAATIAQNAHRSTTAGVDLITYRTNVEQVVTILGALPAGDAMAGSDNAAVPTLTGMMLDRGTKTLDKFAIAAKLDDVGAQISFAVGTQSLEIRAKCLKKDLPLVLGLIAAELRTPALSAAEFAKAKQQFIGGLQASLQNTEERAHEAFIRAIFPEGHPNRPHSVTEYLAAAKTATLDEVKAYHAKYYGPAHFTLILVGDVPEAEIKTEIDKDFAGWSGGVDYIRPVQPAVAAGPRVIQVPLNDKPSVSVRLGQATGLQYRDPGELALRVGTAILGHGFTGRLMHTVRDQDGLTYDIGAGVTDDSITDGSWYIGASFAPSLLNKGLDATRQVLEHWWRDGVSDAELGARKEGLVGGYLVGLSSTGGLANAMLMAVQRGHDLTWLDGYPEAVNALTREQVNQAIHAHLAPATMVLVEAGSVAPVAKAPAPAASSP